MYSSTSPSDISKSSSAGVTVEERERSDFFSDQLAEIHSEDRLLLYLVLFR
jgi:hypothetical protein